VQCHDGQQKAEREGGGSGAYDDARIA
jgi:hypothetical protein